MTRACLLFCAWAVATLIAVIAVSPAGRPLASVADAKPLVREHVRVRWHVYLREHRLSTKLGRKVRDLRRDVRYLRAQLAHARRVAAVQQPPPAAALPHLAAWLCIHRYEGAWGANTGNGYYGGLQMDLAFQQAYGSELLQAKGTADHWTPEEQMAVAERAYASGRGFWPWPNTARMCGLI